MTSLDSFLKAGIPPDTALCCLTDSCTLENAFSYSKMLSVLSFDEIERMASITNPAAKKRFFLGRLFLRHTLAFYLKRSARDITFQYNSHGKPYLNDAGNLTFNLSHTANQFAIAVSLSGEVGIDIEQHKPKRNIQGLANEILTPEELQWFNKQPKQQQLPEFYRLWALKEATLKAQGTGMDISMKSFGFEKTLSVNQWNDTLGMSSSWNWHHTHKENLSIAVALKAFEAFNYPGSADQ